MIISCPGYIQGGGFYKSSYVVVCISHGTFMYSTFLLRNYKPRVMGGGGWYNSISLGGRVAVNRMPQQLVSAEMS